MRDLSCNEINNVAGGYTATLTFTANSYCSAGIGIGLAVGGIGGFIGNSISFGCWSFS